MSRRSGAARCAATLLALALAGCRYHIEHVSIGNPPDPERLARLVPGETDLTEALALLGAPDRVEWGLDEDLLVFDDWEIQKTRWELENPTTFLGPGAAQVAIGEAVGFAVFLAQRTGAASLVPGPGRSGATLGRPAFTSKQLTLEGKEQGTQRVRLVFERASQVLARVEVTQARPRTSVGGLARGTFLR